jgi:quinol monooxygenase YgiN
VLHHVVFFRIRDDTSIEKVRRRLFKLFLDCRNKGTLSFRVFDNQDQRKGFQLVQYSIFRDKSHLEAFRRHPKHEEFTNFLREIADWVVGDFTL